VPDNRRGGGRGVLWAVGALAVCCTVHLLLLTGGLAGIGAALGVLTGNAVLAVAGAVITAIAGVAFARRWRRNPDPGVPTGRPPTRNDRSECDQQR
jgi:hypothetical protein